MTSDGSQSARRRESRIPPSNSACAPDTELGDSLAGDQEIGVATVPPIWFACFRNAIAAFCLFAFLLVRHEVAFPPRPDWPLVAVSGVLQMAAYSALTALALTTIPPGRASVLAFSTPIWVVPLAAWRLRERATHAARVGVGLGLLGVLAIAVSLRSCRASGAGPCIRDALGRRRCLGSLDRHRSRASIHGSTLALAPWQIAFAACLLLPMAIIVDCAPHPIEANGAAALVYVALIATAFAYWAVVKWVVISGRAPCRWLCWRLPAWAS
jgi:drug/metabolite transporter (DMT)-like permease